MANAQVAYHLDQVLKKDSPLMRQARQQGMQSANRRGLLNSSIATGAAQQAVTNAALPIASQQAAQTFQANQAKRDRGLQRELQQGQIGSTEKIAQMNINASRLEKGAATAAAMEALYAQMFSSLQQNPELPAPVRDQYLAHAGKIRDSNMALVEQLYGIGLDWKTPALARTPAQEKAKKEAPVNPKLDRWQQNQKWLEERA